MKKLGITQRAEIHKAYNERRDCLDQRWYPLINALGYTPVPLANFVVDDFNKAMHALDLSAVILSGGNYLSFLDENAEDNAPERDVFELKLIDWAIQNACPLLGVCRGMQMIHHYYQGRFEQINNHVAVTHPIQFSGELSEYGLVDVNSYHQWGIMQTNLPEVLKILATYEDGSVEAFVHQQEKIAGIMWHPERVKDIQTIDIEIMKRFLL